MKRTEKKPQKKYRRPVYATAAKSDREKARRAMAMHEYLRRSRVGHDKRARPIIEVLGVWAGRAEAVWGRENAKAAVRELLREQVSMRNEVAVLRTRAERAEQIRDACVEAYRRFGRTLTALGALKDGG